MTRTDPMILLYAAGSIRATPFGQPVEPLLAPPARIGWGAWLSALALAAAGGAMAARVAGVW